MESAWLYVSASAHSKELSKGRRPNPAARRHGFSALSLPMSPPWSSGAAHAALMLRTPANCNLKSTWLDSPLGLQLGNLATQGIGSFGFLGRIRHLPPKCREAGAKVSVSATAAKTLAGLPLPIPAQPLTEKRGRVTMFCGGFYGWQDGIHRRVG